MKKSLILQIKSIEKNGTSYKSAYLIVDLDYTKKTLTWNKQDIAEILGVSVLDLILKKDGIYKIGELEDENFKK